MRVMLAVVTVAAVLAADRLGRAQDLGSLAQQAEALGARTGVVVADLDRTVRFARRAGEAFAPASNMKLATAAAVLAGLGADHQFTTRFVLRDGGLVVEAGGDPNWITGTEHGPEVVFAALAAALKARGITAVRDIALHQGVFTGPDRPADWPKDQLDRPYCPPTGGLMLDQGTFSLRVGPGTRSTAFTELLAPPAGLPIVGSIALTDRSRSAVWGALDLGCEIKVRGHFLRSARPTTGSWSVRDPATWCTATLRSVLGQHGIAVDPAAAGDGNGEVYVHRSPLQPALLRLLEDSSNFDAEQLLRVLGAATRGDGSLQGGLAALAAELRGLLGELPAGTVLQDGSGLAAGNRLSPQLVVETMAAVLDSPGGKGFLRALSTGGRSGTLSDRFQRSTVAGRVHAKTGWIRGASALSGVLRTASGRTVLFSILMNYDPDQNGLNADLKELQEQMVEAIDRLLEDGQQP